MKITQPINRENTEKKKHTAGEAEKILADRKSKDATPVTIIFKNYETPGAPVTFGIKLHHGEEIDMYELYDGERYRLPLGVAKHLAQECYYKQYKHQPGEEHRGDQGVRVAPYARGLNIDGKLRPVMYQSKKIYRYGVIPLDFGATELDLLPADLVEVSYGL